MNMGQFIKLFRRLSFLSKSTFWIFTGLIAIFFAMVDCSPKRELADLQQAFKNPPDEYLPWVYWFWNGEIDSAKIRFQLEEMKRSHTVSTVVLLAWEGLATEYLSDEWFDQVKYACDVAKEVGLNICLYDEWCWPSGHAGGIMLKNHPELRSKCLFESCLRITGPDRFTMIVDEDPVAVFAVPVVNGNADFNRIINLYKYIKYHSIDWSVPKGEWQIISYQIKPGEFRPVFSDMYYVDLLDPIVAEEFIKINHERYYEKMPEYFGNVISSIITDEPGVYQNLKYWGISPETIAWTPNFRDEFRNRKQYDLIGFLPAIWHDLGAESIRVRNDYYEVVAELLQDSYFKPLHDWAKAHNIKLNIQPSHEEELKYSTIMQGDYFSAMEYSHIQGADAVYSWNPKAITAKIASSAARSFGTQDLFCEVFGAYGWSTTIEEMKAVTDWLFTRGVNHLMMSSYYLDFERDWRMEIAPSLFYRTNYWPFLNTYTNYAARLSVMFSGGQNVAKIVILYPDKSARYLLSPIDETLITELDDNLQKLCEQLLAWQWDYDILNDVTFQQKMKIIRIAGKTVFRLEQGAVQTDYELLILPDVSVIEQGTLDRIKDFYLAGGKVIALGKLPTWNISGDFVFNDVETIWNSEWVGDSKKSGKSFQLANLSDELLLLLQSNLEQDTRLINEIPAVNYIHKRKNGIDIYFISNNDTLPVKTEIEFNIEGVPEIWNPEDGSIRTIVEYRYEFGRTVMPLRLDRYGSILVVFRSGSRSELHSVSSNMVITELNQSNQSINVSGISNDDGLAFIELEYKGQRYNRREQTFVDTLTLADRWQFQSADGIIEPEIRTSGSWTTDYPEFSGIGNYSQTFHMDSAYFNVDNRFFLNIDRVAHSVEIRVNGKRVQQRCWYPFKADVTDYIEPGDNNLELLIANSMANRRDKAQLPSGLLGSVTITVHPAIHFNWKL
ncbi:MAG: glycosyl hydrolase [bacterium]